MIYESIACRIFNKMGLGRYVAVMLNLSLRAILFSNYFGLEKLHRLTWLGRITRVVCVCWHGLISDGGPGFINEIYLLTLVSIIHDLIPDKK